MDKSLLQTARDEFDNWLDKYETAWGAELERSLVERGATLPEAVPVWRPLPANNHLAGKHDQKTHGRSQAFVGPTIPGESKGFNPYAHSNKGKGPAPTPIPPPTPPVVTLPPKFKPSLQQNYIQDAMDTANSNYIKDRVERVKSTIQSSDKVWEPVRIKVVKLGARLNKLSNNHDKEVEKLQKILDDEVKSTLTGSPFKYTKEEMIAQGVKVNEALGKYLKLRRTLADEAWKEIGKHVRSEENQDRNGVYGKSPAMKKVSLRLNSSNDPERQPSPSQQLAIRELENRLTNVLSSRLRDRISETNIRTIKDGEEQRPFFRGTRHGGDGQSIYLEKNTSASTVAHELGHSLETNANIHAAASGFLYLRVGKESAKPMGSGYRDWEVGRDDDFGKAFNEPRYVGKHYKTDDTEIVSMGLEKLYKDPVKFAMDDPQYFKFMIGVIDGTFTS